MTEHEIKRPGQFHFLTYRWGIINFHYSTFLLKFHQSSIYLFLAVSVTQSTNACIFNLFSFFLKIYDPSSIGDHSRFQLSCLSPLVLLFPKHNYLAFISFNFDHPWWRFFQKCFMPLNLISTFFFLLNPCTKAIIIVLYWTVNNSVFIKFV
jgi:hypothetical protein